MRRPTPKHMRGVSRDSCYTDAAFSAKSGESGMTMGVSDVSSNRGRNAFESMSGASEETTKILHLYQDKNKLTAEVRRLRVEMTKVRDENTQLKKKSVYQFNSNSGKSGCVTCSSATGAPRGRNEGIDRCKSHALSGGRSADFETQQKIIY